MCWARGGRRASSGRMDKYMARLHVGVGVLGGEDG